MVGRGFAKGQIKEFFKRKTVIDLVFEFRIRLDAEPFLEHHALKQQQRGPCPGTLATGTDGITLQRNLVFFENFTHASFSM
jgi:hypothetical protein